MKRMRQLLIVCLTLLMVQASAQIKIEAAASKTSLPLHEKLRVDFTINADGDNFVPPDFEESGFTVYSGPVQSIRELWVNGRGTFNKTYTYLLVPEKKGTLILKPAIIEFNNRIYRSNALKITVTDAVDPSKDPANMPVATNSNMYLVTEVSNSNPFVNEPITVIQKLYFNYNTDINDVRDIQKPHYNDFWSQEIETSSFEPEQTVFRGHRCLSVILKKAVVYPQKAGKLVIDPYILEVDCSIPTGRMTIFNQLITRDISQRLKSSGKAIQVKALPESGKTAEFTGAVGDFTFEVIPSKKTLKFGESLDVTLKVSGEGNLKLFQIPRLELSNQWEVYDPEHVEKVSTPISGMIGSIADRYTLVPQSKGTFVIPELSFRYFDPKTKAFKVKTSPSITITVEDGPGIPAGGNASKTGKKQAEQAVFENIKSTSNWVARDASDFLGSTLYYLLLLLPFLGIPLVILYRKRKETQEADVEGNKIKRTNALAKQYLWEAQQNLAQKEPFYVALEKALHNFLKAKLRLETSEMSKETIRNLMKEKGADTITVAAFIKLIENCEFARYAPSSAAAIQTDYDTA
ncbi:MAG: hypothetical protein RLZZ500_710, partial [Bacteroidota bacterium]